MPESSQLRLCTKQTKPASIFVSEIRIPRKKLVGKTGSVNETLCISLEFLKKKQFAL